MNNVTFIISIIGNAKKKIESGPEPTNSHDNHNNYDNDDNDENGPHGSNRGSSFPCYYREKNTPTKKSTSDGKSTLKTSKNSQIVFIFVIFHHNSPKHETETGIRNVCLKRKAIKFPIETSRKAGMGCDFDIYIQVMYGNTWVTIVSFGTKTRCGGYPLTEATTRLYKKTLIHGDYHANDPVVHDEKSEAIKLILNHNEQQEDGHVAKKARRNEADNKEEADEEAGEGDEDDEYEYKSELFLYYSREQFQKLLRYIDPMKEDRHNAYLYNKLMAPVPLWMDMAKSALPLKGGYIWMDHEETSIAETTKAVEEQQAGLVREYEALLVSVFEPWGRLPTHLIPIIASFARPQGQDVRIAWKDIEEQSKNLRNTRSPAHLPPDFTPPPCPIM